MGDSERLIYRLRNDGASWAQPLFDEAADRIEDLERQLAESQRRHAITEREACACAAEYGALKRQLDAARKPEDYWRQVAEATELTKQGFAQDIASLKEERDDLIRDIEKQNKDMNEHQARWQRAERQLVEMLRAMRRIARGAELQAHVMRDPLRTRGWTGAEKVADAFDDIAERARAALPDGAHGPV